MRVIFGSAKGRNLVSPKSKNVRPTADRVKQFIFDCLGNVQECEVLDVFAGSGGLGIESLSRGANFTIFIENSYQSLQTIKKNLELTKLSAKAKILKLDFRKGLETLKISEKKFDLIFADPPYDKNFENKILEKVELGDLLTENGILILEHSNTDFDTDLKLVKHKKFGETNVSFFSKS